MLTNFFEENMDIFWIQNGNKWRIRYNKKTERKTGVPQITNLVKIHAIRREITERLQVTTNRNTNRKKPKKRWKDKVKENVE